MLRFELPKSAVVPAILSACSASLGSVLLATTHIYLIEQYVCREYYYALEPQADDVFLLIGADGAIDERLCKEPAIQSTVARIQGIYACLMFMPALFLAGPWGQIAKVIGKKTAIFINGCSVCAQSCYYISVCYFPTYFNIRWIWAAPLFDILGGGPVIFYSQIYTCIAEEVDATDLSGILFKFTALQLLNSFLAMSFSSFVLRINVWALAFCGIGAFTLIIPFSLSLPSHPSWSNCIPETPPHGPTAISSEPPLAYESRETTSLLSEDFKPQSRTWHILRGLTFHYQHSVQLYRSIFASSALSRLTIITFFFLNLTHGIRVIFTQWASVHYSWSIAEVYVLSSFEMVISSCVLLSLPLLSKRCILPRLLSTPHVDILLARVSLGFIFLGLLCMTVSPNRVCYVMAITVYTLGSGLMDSLRSFSTNLIDSKDEVQKLYLGIGLATTLGGMASSAMWSGTLSAALGKGWFLERAPFWGALIALLVVAFFITRLSKYVGGVFMA